ncbi:hypothetical protein Bbelb_133290 [Branchiostoma belcheri]|nr:hypothetical protein Bbelb_133290 [Branchiostoma belcheri]
MAVRTRHSLSPSDRLDDSRPTRDRSAERNLGSEKEDLAKLSEDALRGSCKTDFLRDPGTRAEDFLNKKAETFPPGSTSGCDDEEGTENTPRGYWSSTKQYGD